MKIFHEKRMAKTVLRFSFPRFSLRFPMGRKDSRVVGGFLDSGRRRGFRSGPTSRILSTQEQVRHRRSRRQILRPHLRAASTAGSFLSALLLLLPGSGMDRDLTKNGIAPASFTHTFAAVPF